MSEPLFPKPNRRVLERLREHGEEVVTASVVWHELLFGYHRLPPSARREAIGRYLEEVVEPSIPILPYDARAAQWHAAERARLGAVGRTPSFADGQIAAVASVNSLAVVTANTTDYADFGDLEVVNWHG